MAAKPHQSKPQAGIVTQQQWSGPLPPPAALAQFNNIIPNGAERIVVMVEREQQSRQDLDKQAIFAQIQDTQRGHYIGAFIAALAIGASVYTAYIGAHWSVSVALVSLPIAAIINSIRGKR